MRWLAGRSYLLRNASTSGEPTFAEAAAVLAPPHDYKLLGLPSSYHKWSCTQDGYIKRATTAIYGQGFTVYLLCVFLFFFVRKSSSQF